MSIRRKIALITALSLLGLLGLLCAASQFIVARSFGRLEEELARASLERAMRALAREVEALATTTVDWAAWDDTCEFIEGRAPEYERSNLGDVTLEELGLAFALFVRRDRQVVFAKALDPEGGGETALPEGLLQHVREGGGLASHRGPTEVVSGVVVLPAGAFMVASAPIVTSRREGPVRGAVVFGRRLGAREVAELGEVTDSRLAAAAWGEAGWLLEEAGGERALLGPGAPVRALDGEWMAAYGVVRDIYGGPAAAVRAMLPRQMHARASATILYLVAAFLLVGLATGSVGYMVLERAVLMRLARLSARLREIARERDPSARVAEGGGDELGEVAESVNAVLSALERAQRSVRESERRFRELAEQLPEPLFEVDLQGQVTYANPAALRAFGYEPADVARGVNVFDIVAEGDREDARQRVARLLAGGGPEAAEYRARRRDGSEFPVAISATAIVRDGQVRGVRGVANDLTERRRAEAALRVKDAALSSAIHAVAIADPEGRLTYANESFLRLWGYEDQRQVVGRSALEFWHTREEAGAALAAVQARGSWVGELAARRADGSAVEVQLSATLVKDDAGRPICLMASFMDITDRKRSEEMIRRRALYDPLTELPNRALLEDRTKVAFAQARRSGRLVAVMYLDIDRFKVVNDTFGHALGDQLLRDLGARLRESVRESDTVARVGGDEFVVLLGEVADRWAAGTAAREVLGALSGPLEIDGREVHITASAGVSLYPRDGEEAGELFKKADAALYAAKQEGRSQVRFYTARMDAESASRVALEGELRKGFERGEFVLRYQPQIEIETGRVVGVEALLQWRHPRRGLLAAKEFIEVAAESSLMEPLGEWVLREACAQAGEWERAGRGRRVWVNLSAREFYREDLVRRVEGALAQAGLEASRLGLEVSESAAMWEVEGTLARMGRLGRRGIGLALDDFGLGSSSLVYLKQLPVEVLKIDRSFIRDLATSARDRAIVEAIIAMTRSLGIVAIAEGVETEEQLALLHARGCAVIQGYLVSHPVSAQEMEALLEAEALPGGLLAARAPAPR